MPSNAFARPAFGPALAVTVFSSLAPPLFAADTQLQTVTVQASSQADDDALPTRPPTSVYGGTETKVLDTPRSITQVNAEQLANDPIRSADDLVKYAPGITRGGGQNAGIAPQFRAQGSEVFQDGQRAYGVRHPANFNAYEGADIVAGPSSVTYGSVSGSGGYVNYLSKKPNFSEFKTRLSGELGAWVPDGQSRDSRKFSIDNTGPLSDQLAYRVSITQQRQQDYYDNVDNNFDAFYGALAWRNDNLRVDWNASYDNYYDYNITHGWNRATQQLVDSGQYYAGRATPIIQNGKTLWSPVLASGAANAPNLGWVQRQRNAQGQYSVVDGSFQGASPNTQASPGTLRGWVYDPSLAGNGLTSLSPQAGQRGEDQSSSRRFTTQLRVEADLSPTITLANSTFYQRSRDLTDAVGAFQVQSKDNLLDNRFEFRSRNENRLGDLTLRDDSNSGLIYRREFNQSIAANNHFGSTINAYDLTLDPSGKNPGDLLGLTGSNPAGGNGAWIGQPGVPQYSNYYGWLNLAAMYPAGHGLYAESVAPYTAESTWTTKTLFSQHNLRLGERVGLNIGASRCWIDARIDNPFVLAGGSDRRDSHNYRLFAFQVSPYVKPTENSTLYYTFDRSLAVNTGFFSNGLGWGSGSGANQLNPLAFQSLSVLHELGLKVEAIPDQLFMTLATFKQARDQSPDSNNIARLIIKGTEATLRYQPDPHLRSGLNLSRLSAYNEFTSQAGFASAGFIPDNGTVFGDNNSLNQRPSGRFDALQIPEYTASGYLDYRFDSGFGAELSGWWTSSWYLNLSKTVKVPDEYNLDLALYYRQPQWSTTLRVLNLTNELNFVSGLAGSTNTFLQPMPGRTVLAQVDYRF
ncbi:TonB-dependent receptor-like protein [Pseudomonas protegens]|uniref:TonB-dependent receptor plug domain-containing protein n=1 Tax=Pseudomonas TaxID=286 RepID=UPI000F4AF3DB|nr:MULTISPECIES: TonB-dependent receptor plug domain-containing protein [Pseudomonas]MCS4259295.1 outer membrane receptor for monomeric catechols [Pseudomonas sp. BIGb0176]ROQ56455.1 TonB-dependent receptor-like protein [Pseudomonas protegens]ROQ85446.1 TonB-dependent receptor-like protein [Pseudomonas protegens]